MKKYSTSIETWKINWIYTGEDIKTCQISSCPFFCEGAKQKNGKSFLAKLLPWTENNNDEWLDIRISIYRTQIEPLEKRLRKIWMNKSVAAL